MEADLDSGHLTYVLLDAADVIIELNVHSPIYEDQLFPSMAALVGTLLLDHIAGKETRDLIASIVRNARQSRRVSLHPYRCDEPGTNRYCEMIVTPEDNGRVRLQHRLVKEDHVPVVLCSEGSVARESVRCSMCNRLRRNGRWHEHAVTGDPLRREARSLIIYKICGDCLEANLPRMAPRHRTNRDS